MTEINYLDAELQLWYWPQHNCKCELYIIPSLVQSINGSYQFVAETRGADYPPIYVPWARSWASRDCTAWRAQVDRAERGRCSDRDPYSCKKGQLRKSQLQSAHDPLLFMSDTDL